MRCTINVKPNIDSLFYLLCSTLIPHLFGLPDGNTSDDGVVVFIIHTSNQFINIFPYIYKQHTLWYGNFSLLFVGSFRFDYIVDLLMPYLRSGERKSRG
jgi:hypothetical protein